jgi:copper chaperone CopZ
MESKTVNVPGIHCGHCVMNIKREVSELPGVKSVEGDPGAKQITVQWEAPATWEQIDAAMKDAGYPAA